MRVETHNFKSRALRMAALVALLAFAVPLLAQEPEWANLGETQVHGVRDHHRFKVGRSPESFRAIEFRVAGGDVEFDRIVIQFENGRASDRLMHVRIPSGAKTKTIDLPGGRRIIHSVEVWYHQDNGSNRPTVSLFGLR
jgi:hypothetical protein